MKGLVIASGKINNLKLLNKLIDENDYIVCADGGLDHILKVGKRPNEILGDLDSISEEGMNYIKDKNIRLKKFPSVKDNTDSELAIKHLIDMGIKDITLVGATGSRLDHTIANIFLLRKFNKNGIILRIVDDNNIINYIVDGIRFDRNDGSFISIVPLNDDGAVVSLSGFKYPLVKKHIEFSSTLGISNEISEEFGVIKVHKGETLVIEAFD